VRITADILLKAFAGRSLKRIDEMNIQEHWSSLTEQVDVMISSTIMGLETERNLVADRLRHTGIVHLVGAEPASFSSTASPLYTTEDTAKSCDLYILILGDKFGTKLRD
jgi:hypothetical protein